MKHYKVLEQFNGSQEGYTEPQTFLKGEVYALTEHLAEVALKYGYVEEVASIVAERRETKEVKIEAAEVKPAKKKK